MTCTALIVAGGKGCVWGVISPNNFSYGMPVLMHISRHFPVLTKNKNCFVFARNNSHLEILCVKHQLQ